MKKLIDFLTAPVPNFVLAIFGILFLVSSCSMFIQTKFKAIDPELKPYVEDYYSIINRYCKNGNYNKSNNYNIQLIDRLDYDDKREIIGLCFRQINGYYILISRYWWGKATIPDKRQLLYHELSHCVINKDHVDDKDNYMYSGFIPLMYNDLNDQVSLDIIKSCNDR